MYKIKDIEKDISRYKRKNKAKKLHRFFKTGVEEYAEGDIFLGLKTEEIKIIAKKYREISLSGLKELLRSKIHDYRNVAIRILNYQFQKKDIKAKKRIYSFYLENLSGINNWDLVDNSAHKIMGAYLYISGNPRKILFSLARSNNLWEKRIAMIATYYFIKEQDFHDALKIAEILLYDKEDLIHKAVGWMLREIGNRDMLVEERFLKKNYKDMPRTMLRYSIEKFPENKRQDYLKGRI